MKSITLFNEPVRVNDDGLVCLTDIWKVARDRANKGDAAFLGGRAIDSIRPANFLQADGVQAFINELAKCSPGIHLESTRGNGGGTFANRFIAYKYASYIDPAFEVGVYTVLDDFFTGELQRRNSLSAQLNMKCHEFDQKKDMASYCGSGLASWRYAKPALLSEINSLANQLQITIPGLPQ
ncbi:KilA-N domain-containing protein [Cronobacter sakazakii]